jgi:hypothetical protein
MNLDVALFEHQIPYAETLLLPLFREREQKGTQELTVSTRTFDCRGTDS